MICMYMYVSYSSCDFFAHCIPLKSQSRKTTKEHDEKTLLQFLFLPLRGDRREGLSLNS